MDLRTFDNPKVKGHKHVPKPWDYKKPKVDPVAWARALVSRQGVESAIRIARRNAVDMHIGYKKQSEPNSYKSFYKQALNFILNTHRPKGGGMQK